MPEVEACTNCDAPRDGAKYCKKCGGAQFRVRQGATADTAAPPTRTAQREFEYHVVGVSSLAGKMVGGTGVQTEVDKRAGEGWRLAFAYPEPDGKRHCLIFERAISR